MRFVHRPPFSATHLFTGSHQPVRGPRVRLRLARRQDAAAIRALLERQGGPLEELELARLVRFDPRRRVVVCATALVGAAEKLLGVGAIDLGADVPDTLVVDEEQTDGLRGLLGEALRSRVESLAA